MTSADGTFDPQSVGPAVEEAAKLFHALAEWARERGPELGAALAGMASHAAGGLSGTVNDHIDNGAPECDWCPVCRTVHFVKQTSPEVRDHLLSAATSLLQASASWMGTAGVSGDPSTRRAEVQNIDLSGNDDWPTA